MIKTKITVCFAISLLLTTFCFSQTEVTEETEKNHKIFFTMAPLLIVNTESSTKSAPSPIVFSCGIGAKFSTDKKISFIPRLSFFTNYYLWDGENALPAEVENRTATALSFLFDLPVVYNLHMTENSSFEIGGGVALLARYGLLSNGVSSSDSGASGNASDDVSKINDWFWKDMHYLFPELMASWNFKVNRRLTAGLEGHVYFPLGSLTGGRGIDAMMITVATRLMF